MENDLPDLEAVAAEAHRLHTAGFGEVAEAVNAKFDTKYTPGNMALMVQRRDSDGQKRPYTKREPKEKIKDFTLTLCHKNCRQEHKATIVSNDGESITLDVQEVGVFIIPWDTVRGLIVGA